MSETKQISNINTLRGFAALSVCMFHTAGTGSLHSAGLLDKFSFLFQYGYLGVQVFFVIYGFVIP
jgi:peptidoglycan/LPS O-acetylase OafA/YrhL